MYTCRNYKTKKELREAFMAGKVIGCYQPGGRFPGTRTGYTTIEGGVTVRSSVYRDHVTYQPSGLAYGSNLSFAVCARGAAAGRAVIVSNTGRARVARRMPDGTRPCPRG